MSGAQPDVLEHLIQMLCHKKLAESDAALPLRALRTVLHEHMCVQEEAAKACVRPVPVYQPPDDVLLRLAPPFQPQHASSALLRLPAHDLEQPPAKPDHQHCYTRRAHLHHQRQQVLQKAAHDGAAHMAKKAQPVRASNTPTKVMPRWDVARRSTLKHVGIAASATSKLRTLHGAAATARAFTPGAEAEGAPLWGPHGPQQWMHDWLDARGGLAAPAGTVRSVLQMRQNDAAAKLVAIQKRSSVKARR